MPQKASRGDVFKGVLAVIAIIFVSLAALLAIWGAFKAFSRYQKRADAANQVRVTKTKIRVAQQQVKVQQQFANVKVAEAVGIRRAQDEINKTLTPLYIQHEAIQAQEEMARSGRNNTIIYTPSGNNGVPLVQDITAGTERGSVQAGSGG